VIGAAAAGVRRIRTADAVVPTDDAGRALGEAAKTVEVRRDRTFSFSAAPGRIQLTVLGAHVRGSQGVEVRSGEVTTCEVHAHEAGRVEIDGVDRYAADRLVVMMKLPNGATLPWIVHNNGLSVVSSTSRTLAPGRYDYTVMYGVPSSGLGAVDVPVIASGTLVVEAGGEHQLRLP